ncbi:SMI1/KNR4 family protein [Amycolatopsis halotolerans]|uniref:SMI1/KNR4 family protein n=1 Tax=Amycolatopsis halotolerans TaxID=330083 RepID=A0ABV7QLT5_9PSEU
MDWRPWLSRWSAEWVQSAKPADLDPQVLRDRWLGFAPASAEAVAGAEARLGRKLPPSYREFLLTTDGWRDAGPSVRRMRDTAALGWLRDLEPHWEEWEELSEGEPNPSEGNKFSRGLLISLEADVGILFLDPGDVDEAGEWAAYSLFSWLAEPPAKFASFAALMEDLYADFHRLRRPEGETRDAWDAKVEQARLDALAGEVDSAAAVLKQAEKFGRDRATVLMVQLDLFLGRDYPAGLSLSRLLHSEFARDGFFADPLFTEEFMPWLLAEHARATTPYHRSTLRTAMMGERPEIQLAVGEGQARLRRDGQRPRFGNPEFDLRVREALDQHTDDPEALWRAVRAALVHWRPRSADHVAPIALLADPVLAATFTGERGREMLAQPRGDQ